MIRPYLNDIINDHKSQGEWKVCLGNTVIDYKTQGEWEIHLTMTINFIPSEDSNETRTMHAKSNNIEIMIRNETDEIITESFESPLQRYQDGFEESVRGNNKSKK